MLYLLLQICQEQTYWFHSHPFCVWILGSSRGHWQHGPKRKATYSTLMVVTANPDCWDFIHWQMPAEQLHTHSYEHWESLEQELVCIKKKEPLDGRGQPFQKPISHSAAVSLNTDSFPVFPILLFLLLFGPPLCVVWIFLLHLPLSALGPGYWIVVDVVLQRQLYMNRTRQTQMCLFCQGCL